VTEAWVTDDDLRRARERFAAAIPGWVQPALHGIVTTSADGVTRVEVASGLDHRLPAVVLASVLGHSAGTSTYEVSRERLAAAAELLAPAEAALHTPHPNLWAWRRVLAESPVLIEAVFVNDVGDAVSSEADRLLRSSL
jgi:hypothetical protein